MHMTGRYKAGNTGKGASMQDRILHLPFDERPTCFGALHIPAIYKNIHTAFEAGISGAAPSRHAGYGSATCHEETSNELRPKDTAVR